MWTNHQLLQDLYKQMDQQNYEIKSSERTSSAQSIFIQKVLLSRLSKKAYLLKYIFTNYDF